MKFTKIGYKLFSLFLLVSLIPLCIAGTVVYNHIYGWTSDEVFKQLEPTANRLNGQLNLLLSLRRFRVIDFGSDGFIRDCVEQMAQTPHEFSQISKNLNTHLIINKKGAGPGYS